MYALICYYVLSIVYSSEELVEKYTKEHNDTEFNYFCWCKRANYNLFRYDTLF